MMSYRVYAVFLALLWLLQAAMGLSPQPHELELEQQHHQQQSWNWWAMARGCLATSHLAAPRRVEAMLTEEDVTDIILKSEQGIMGNMNNMNTIMKNMNNMKKEMKNMRQEMNTNIELLDRKIENLNEKFDAKIKLLDQKIENIIGKFDAHVEKIDAEFQRQENMLIWVPIVAILLSKF